MHISILLMEQIIQLFLMIFMGFLIVKARLLNSEDSKILSIIVLYLIIPCVITIYQDRSFTFILKTPPAPVLIKKACGIETASAKPNKDKVAKLTKAQVEEIAKQKMPDLNAASLEAAMSMIKGTARSMGITVEE